MADLATADAGHTSNFANGERREVIVQHELPLLFAFVAFHALSVVGGAESCRDQRLGFAAGKECGAVHAGEDAGLDRDRADLVEGAVIGADAVVENLLAEDGFAQAFKVLGELLRSRGIVGGELFLEFVLDLLDLGVALELGVLLGVERVLETVTDLGLEGRGVGFVVLERSDFALGLAGERDEVLNAGDDLLDLFVGELDGADDDFFGDFLGAGLDHHDAVLGADDHDVELADEALGVGGIDDVLVVNVSNAHSTYRSVEGDVRERQSAAGTVDAEHVRIIFLVGRVHERDHLGLVAKGLREERADGAIDLPRGKDLLLRGAAFALDEAARDASAGVGELAILDREGEEVDAFLGVGRGYGCGENGVVAAGGEGRARCLLGDASCFEFDVLATGKLNGYVLLHKRSSFSLCL